MSNINDRIRVHIEKFVDEIRGLIQQQTLEAVQEAVGRNPGSKGMSTRRSGRVKGQKRTPEELAQVAGRVLAFIVKNPSCTIEQIGKELGESTADLTLPIRKLLREKSIGKKGRKRSTRYTAK